MDADWMASVPKVRPVCRTTGGGLIAPSDSGYKTGTEPVH